MKSPTPDVTVPSIPAASGRRRVPADASIEKKARRLLSSAATLWGKRRVGPALPCCLAGFLAGCLNLEPAEDTARYFVLSATASQVAMPPSQNKNLAVGIRPIRVPAYLNSPRFAVRHGENEVRYLESSQWAERMDKGLQRVLARNLAALLDSTRIETATWGRDSVACELDIMVARFETDSEGTATLEATWRVVRPNGEELLAAGQSRATKAGPAPSVQPEGAAAALSEAWADFSKELARKLGALAF